jgi:cyclopropane fatty-acyl-phospholipid synthase-like methyltransferase
MSLNSVMRPLLRPLHRVPILDPVIRMQQLSLLRQRLRWTGSGSFWEKRYAEGLTSGEGSYGELGMAKAEFLNEFIRVHDVHSVIEFGCGDGHQLSLANYPTYVGLDVSPTAIDMCKDRFSDDLNKSFFLYDGRYFVDRQSLFTADLALSLDVIYHLVEDTIFETYMSHLFAAGQRYVVVYSTNSLTPEGDPQVRYAPHVRHRCFTSWVTANCPEWRLVGTIRGPLLADFFVYVCTTSART